METKLKLIKRQTNKPSTKVTLWAKVQLNSCSRGEEKKRRKVFKGRNLAPFGWHIYTIMWRIQSSSASSTINEKFQVSSSRLPFFFGVKVSKWVCETDLLTLMELHWLTQTQHIKESTKVYFCDVGYFFFFLDHAHYPNFYHHEVLVCVQRFIWVVVVVELCLSSVLDPRMQS